MFNKRNNNYDNIDLNNLRNYKSPNNEDEEDNNQINNMQNIINPSKISSKNDVPIIKEMMEMDSQFISLMKNRINIISPIANSYQSGKFDDVMNRLEKNNDLGALNDYFRYTLIKKEPSQINLNIDMALNIFPKIFQMVNSKYDAYFKTGINTAWAILNYFSDQIIQVLKTPLFNGVDLNREEKVRKYKMLVEYFSDLRGNPRVENNLKYKEIKGLNLKQFIGEVNFCINQCK